ncbi:MAG: DUF3365 domain-containing protein [Planctomycetaceae bacterium]
MKTSSQIAALLCVVLFFGCQAAVEPTVSETEYAPADPATEQVASPDAETGDSEPVATEEVAVKNEEHGPGEEHEHGPGGGHGPGRGGPGFRGGRGPGGMAGMRPDMTTIHGMFGDRDKIRRTVKLRPDGAEALTESDDEKIAAFIKQHVPNMDARVLENNPLPPMTFHPVFVQLIKNSEKYTLQYDETEKGVKVTYQSDDPYVVMLVQEHAKLVSRFIRNGMEEIHTEYELPKFDEKIATAQAKAITARDALFQKLSGRLTEVIAAEGPAAAIEVCSREAAQLAEMVGKEQGVKIGRTALKLRNPKNTAPAWVQPLLESPPSEGQFVNLENDTVGALLPIRLQAKCVTCHGPQETLQEEIKAKLAEHYPNDAATGFKEGDLRGWFWVEVAVK